ncbi:MAG: hypothetical protein RMY29_022840 [Nostoc sp. CreGUA01]
MTGKVSKILKAANTLLKYRRTLTQRCDRAAFIPGKWLLYSNPI